MTHACDAQQLEAERKEKEMLESKIKAMESKVLQGGVNLLEKVSRAVQSPQAVMNVLVQVLQDVACALHALKMCWKACNSMFSACPPASAHLAVCYPSQCTVQTS
jgi:hypothetical protein